MILTLLAFVRANGDRIEPGPMFTDGGSIPRVVWFESSLSPWAYGPAFLIHDWEFDLKHCKRNERSFEEVRDTMMEAIKTLIEMDLAPHAPTTFRLIYQGVNSIIARDMRI